MDKDSAHRQSFLAVQQLCAGISTLLNLKACHGSLVCQVICGEEVAEGSVQAPEQTGLHLLVWCQPAVDWHEARAGEAGQTSLTNSTHASPQMCQVIQPMIAHQEVAARFEGLQADKMVRYLCHCQH